MMGCRLQKCIIDSKRIVQVCKDSGCLCFRSGEHTICPTCKAIVWVKDGKIKPHETGKGSRLYPKYHAMSRKTGIPVSVIARDMLCDEFKKGKKVATK